MQKLGGCLFKQDKMQIIDTIKRSFQKDKIQTIFMAAILVLSLLTFIKPTSPLTFQGIATYAGTSIVNLLIFLLVIGAIIYFIKTK